jgi:hypothetical protein
VVFRHLFGLARRRGAAAPLEAALASGANGVRLPVRCGRSAVLDIQRQDPIPLGAGAASARRLRTTTHKVGRRVEPGGRARAADPPHERLFLQTRWCHGQLHDLARSHDTEQAHSRGDDEDSAFVHRTESNQPASSRSRRLSVAASEVAEACFWRVLRRLTRDWSLEVAGNLRPWRDGRALNALPRSRRGVPSVTRLSRWVGGQGAGSSRRSARLSVSRYKHPSGPRRTSRIR